MCLCRPPSFNIEVPGSRAKSRLPAGASAAFAFVFTMGVVNLFGDTTYEGGASINGQFLGSLGASAAAISIIAGAGEFLGYSLRSVAGWTADKTGRYWPVTFVGFAINSFRRSSFSAASE